MAVNRYDKDEELNVRVDFSYFSMLKKYVAPYVKTIILVLLSMFLTAFLELLPPYFLSIVLDKCLPESNYKLIIILGCVLILSYLIVMFNQKWRSKITNNMAMNIIKALQMFPQRGLFSEYAKHTLRPLKRFMYQCFISQKSCRWWILTTRLPSSSALRIV